MRRCKDADPERKCTQRKNRINFSLETVHEVRHVSCEIRVRVGCKCDVPIDIESCRDETFHEPKLLTVESWVSFRVEGKRVGVKAFEASDSFAFNTKADPALYSEQFRLMKRLVSAGFDVYGYVT